MHTLVYQGDHSTGNQGKNLFDEKVREIPEKLSKSTKIKLFCKCLRKC